MISRLSLMNLAGIAGIIGVVGSGISLSLVYNARNRVKKQPYFLNAFKTLKQNRAAIDLIGEPIHVKNVDLSDTLNNCFEPLSARIKVPFKGNKKSGDLFIWANREHDHDQWVLRRLEIVFTDLSDRKVIVYKNETNNELQ